MFIGHYKGVQSSKEFYSEKQDNLNFPTQVVLDGERYLLVKTIQISSKNQYKTLVDSAKKFSIKYDVKLD